MEIYCNHCGYIGEPESELYKKGSIGNGSENWEQDEYYDVCPNCGSEDLSEDIPEEEQND